MLQRSLAKAIAFAITCVLFLAAPRARPQFEDEPKGPVTEAQFVERALAKMKEHNYFSKVLVQVDRSQPPLALFLHKPQVEQPGWDTRIVGTYAPWLKKLEELFRTTYVGPLGWKRRDDMPLYAVCQLQTEGDYVNYRKSQQEYSFNSNFATYDKKLRAVVAYQEFGKLKPADKRYYLMAEFVRELIAAHFHGNDRPAQAWLLEGLGAYWADHAGDDVKALDKRYVDAKDVELLVTAAQDAAQRDIYLLPIAELAATRGVDQVWLWMSKRGAAAGVQDLDGTRQWRGFHAQSALWMHYLHDGDAAKHRPALMKFLTSAMAGAGGADALSTAFEPLALADLDRDFYRWVFARFEANNAGRKLDRRWIDELFLPRLTVSGPGPITAAPKLASGPSPAELLPARADVAAQHGAILQRARRGDLEGAQIALTELEASARSGPFGRRIASDLERVTRFIVLRNAYVADLIASGGKLEFEWAGKKHSAKPTRVEHGLVMLDENRAKLASLPLTSLDAFDVARAVPKKIADGEGGWIRTWAYVLVGDQRWKTLLKGDAPEIAALRSDALEWYPPLLELGAAAQALTTLADTAAPTDAASAQKCLDAIRELRESHGDLQLIKDRGAALVRLATVALEKQFAPSVLAQWLHGVVELLPDDALRVTYEFETPAEARDFRLDPLAAGDWHKAFDGTLKSMADSAFVVADGALRGNGSVSYRVPFALEAPLSVAWEMQYGYTPDVGGTSIAVRFVVCDDAQGNFIACDNIGSLVVWDQATALYLTESSRDMQLDPAHTYSMRLAVDGKHATTTVDGQEIKKLSCGSRKQGAFYFAVHGDPGFALKRIAFEGKLGFAATRSAWIAHRLAELGFAAQ